MLQSFREPQSRLAGIDVVVRFALMVHVSLFEPKSFGTTMVNSPQCRREKTGEIVRDGRQRGEAVCQQSKDGAEHGHERLAYATLRHCKLTRTEFLRSTPALASSQPSDSKQR
jgi:hypothetical protein